MKTLFIGDVHAKSKYILPCVDLAIKKTGAKRVVLLGDYCDDWYVEPDYMYSDLAILVQWVCARRYEGTQIDVLLGNHDIYYAMGECGVGAQHYDPRVIRTLLSELDPQIATVADGRLCTHAGVVSGWAIECLGRGYYENANTAADMLNTMLQDSWRLKDLATRVGSKRGGSGAPSPLWADKDELCTSYVHGYSQIVGHTSLPTVGCFTEGDIELWFCDTFSLYPSGKAGGDGSMLLLNGGACTTVPFESPSGQSWEALTADYVAKAYEKS